MLSMTPIVGCMYRHVLSSCLRRSCIADCSATVHWGSVPSCQHFLLRQHATSSTTAHKEGASEAVGPSRWKPYMQLAKARLTGLVMVTSAAGYVLALPVSSSSIVTSHHSSVTSHSIPEILQALASHPTVGVCGAVAMTAVGTGLVAAAANTINQLIERRHDALMIRTAVRPLVTATLSCGQAVAFSGACGISGALLLYTTQPLAAVLAVSNLVLYTCIYTPLKRVSVVNTWVGAIVGAIPPLIGWAAANGDASSLYGGCLLAALLYGWQFPHFNALSWNLRKEYARAGYRMMASFRPALCRRVALRYSCLLAALPVVTSYCDVTHWMYAVTTSPVSAYLLLLSWRFYRRADSASARSLTRYSYVYLLCCMLLVLACRVPVTEQHHSAPHQVNSEGMGSEWWGRLCVGRPLMEAGWNMTSLLATAEKYNNKNNNVDNDNKTTTMTFTTQQ